MLQNILYNPRKQSLSPERIVETVAKYYGVPSDQLRGKARDKQIVLPRQIAMYLMREETEAPLLRIGEALGGRDHSTVLHGCEKIEREMGENDDSRRAPRSWRAGSPPGGRRRPWVTCSSSPTAAGSSSPRRTSRPA